MLALSHSYAEAMIDKMNRLKAALRLNAMSLKAQIGRSLKMHQ